MQDGLKATELVCHRFYDVASRGETGRALGDDDLAVDLHFEATGVATDKHSFDAERLMECFGGGGGLGQVVAGDAIEDGDQRSGGALAPPARLHSGPLCRG
jgi:hypothetical protein